MLVGLPDGKPSRTRIQVEQRFEGYTLLRCNPLTGRTHQIRVHLSWAGFPLVIDPTYGRRETLKLSEIKRGYKAKRGAEERPLMARLTLHAAAIAWPADDGQLTRVEAPLPADFTRLLRQLSKVRPHRRWRS
jgi:23S rRNA pseudouridine955/2504/2580 synthase